jgi:NitT/TauT family transport system substrate-binding protein
MKRATTILLITVAIIVSGCTREPSATPAAPRVVLRQEWFPYAGFAGEVVAAKRFAPAEGIELQVVPGSEAVDPIKLVVSKSSDYAVASSDLVVSAIQKGAPLVVIGVINSKSPTCFIVPAASKIHRPADFVANRVGILSGTNTERVYALMMNRSGVDRSKVREMEVPFDVASFALGAYDVRPAFIYDEPVSLEKQSFKYRVIRPEEHGVSSFLGTVYFTRQDVIASRRDETQKLVNALVKGWRFTLANPDDAIADLVTAFPSLDKERERRSIELGKPYFSGTAGKLLWATPDQWQEMLRGLETVGAIPKGSVTVAQVWDPSFVEAAQ